MLWTDEHEFLLVTCGDMGGAVEEQEFLLVTCDDMGDTVDVSAPAILRAARSPQIIRCGLWGGSNHNELLQIVSNSCESLFPKQALD